MKVPTSCRATVVTLRISGGGGHRERENANLEGRRSDGTREKVHFTSCDNRCHHTTISTLLSSPTAYSLEKKKQLQIEA
ncbi:Eukaryotic initiation factor 4A-II [Sesbania bispinosa]|nr:Eukaryotic initiation factor 4A-II [Sesbania bispinosa]